MCGVQWVGEGDVGQCVNCVHVCVVCSGWGRGMLVSVLIVCMCVWCAVGGGSGWGRGMLVSVLIVCMCVWCAVGGGGGCWSVC